MVIGLPLLETSNKIYDKCLISKHSRNSSSNHTTYKASEVLNVVYSDVYGPFDTPSLVRNRYFVSFGNGLGRKLCIYLIKVKSDVYKTFKDFKALMEK